MLIMVTDPIISRFEAELTSHGADGHRWLMAAEWTPERILRALPEVDVLVASRMTEEMAVAGSRLRLVQVTGAGYDRIPLDALAPDVAVANTYHHGRSIAEHVLMSMLMLSRRVLRADRQLRAGHWESVSVDSRVPFGETLAGRSVGLIGLGEIGAQVARVALAMRMRVQAVRRHPRTPLPDDLRLDWVGGIEALPTLLGGSDVVVVTVPLTARTRELVGAAELAAMKPTAYLINVSRGPVVGEHALYQALMDGQIAGAALDVWWSYPVGGDANPGSSLPFHELDNVVLTPHHSGHTRETFEGRARDIAENVANLAQGAALKNLVRTPDRR